MLLLQNGMKRKIDGMGACNPFSKNKKYILYISTFSTNLI